MSYLATYRVRPAWLVCRCVFAAWLCLVWPLLACSDVRTPVPDADTRFIFVAPDGDNANPGTSADQPVASVQIGLERLRDHHADWLLLKRGHTYTAETLARLPDGRNAEHPAILGAYGEGPAPTLIVTNAASHFTLQQRRDRDVALFHVNLIHTSTLQAPTTQQWNGVATQLVQALDHDPVTGIEAVLEDPVGMTNVAFDVSGELDKGAMIALRVGPRTRLSGLASEDGVTIRGWGVRVKDAPEAGLEHLRIRLGDDNVQDAVDNLGNVLRAGKGDRSQDGSGADCLQVFSSPGARFAHLSLFWGLDEGMSIGDSAGVHLYRSIIAESLSEAYHTGGPDDGERIVEHSKALLITGWDVPQGFFPNNYDPIVVRECLFAHNTDRCPAWADSSPGLTGGGKTLLNLAFVNNVVYNAGRFLGHANAFPGSDPTVRVDFVGNVFVLGPDSPEDFQPQYWVNLINTVNSPDGSVYVANNWVIDRDGVAHDLLDWMDARDLPWADQPHFTYDTPLMTDRDTVIDTVLTYAGDYTHRDEHDWRIVNDTRNGTGRIIDSQTEVISD